LPGAAPPVSLSGVSALLQGVDIVIELVRRAALALAALLLVIFTIDWLVRTRRLSPFGPIARFFRRVVDPLLDPVERRVVRAGGLPSAAPWWALVAAVAGGILLLLLLSGARGVIAEAMIASRSRSGLYRLVVEWTFGFLKLALIVRVLASWLRVSPYSRWLRWCAVLTEWLLRPLRRVIPPIGMMDVSPIVAIFVLWLAESALLSVW
jgi:YggT family protein